MGHNIWDTYVMLYLFKDEYLFVRAGQLRKKYFFKNFFIFFQFKIKHIIRFYDPVKLCCRVAKL